MSMMHEPPATKRELLTETLQSDLVVVGGGLAGVCCAITAARAGVSVTLIQDRPVLGGNSSSEVRLWVLGATAHMNSLNRWAREGGVIDEIETENMYRNPEGNPLIFDTVLLEKVIEEPNIRLLLNTAVFEVQKSNPDKIEAVTAFCSQNSTLYHVSAPLFCDASGDGIMGFLSGAAFRMGAESREEFDEGFAPNEEYGFLLGHSIYFYSKDVGKPVKFVPPSYALTDITQIPRFRTFNTKDYGCRLWWIEYGGRLDTVHDTEKIKWELWKVVYGVWNYIKNSGEFPDAENLTLEWVGQIPGKRESRRFEGPYMLRQQDIIEQRQHEDAVAFGGWSIDLHPADGVFSEKPGCNQWYTKGIYQIPYRCLYSKNIENLFLAGRVISASHVAFGSSRVMGTCAHGAQAVALAAKLCKEHNVLPAEISKPEYIKQLQRDLLRTGQHIPGLALEDAEDLVQKATISASSELHLSELPADAPVQTLHKSLAQLLPVTVGPTPTFTFEVDVDVPTTLQVELRVSDRVDNHVPNVVLATQTFELEPGSKQRLETTFQAQIEEPRYLSLCFMQNEHVAVYGSNFFVTGLTTSQHRRTQEPPEDIGVETLEMWMAIRRPEGRNLALTIEPPIAVFGSENIRNGITRPTRSVNAWVAEKNDAQPTLELRWQEEQRIERIELSFDTDFDHAMESVLFTHPENAMPFCVKHYRICDAHGQVLVEETNNYQTRNTIRLAEPVVTDRLTVQLLESHGDVPASLFEVRCY